MDNPLLTDVYSEHVRAPTCAAFSPSGNYVASGDSAGLVRVWATNNESKTLKKEVGVIGGPLADIAWSEDNQRIVAVGEGSEKFGAVFSWDSGTSIGEIAGHPKKINAVDFKPSRPFRIVTASEDNTVALHQGPPFKFQKRLADHSRFVNDIRYSPSGDHFVSVGSDGTGFIYDGKDGEKIGELGSDNKHSGTIYGVSWSPDGKQLVTCSADKTCKIWDVESRSVVNTFTFGDNPTAEQMQVGVVWAGKHIVSLALSGDLSYLDVNDPSKPLRVLRGHQSAVTSVAYDAASKTLVSGSNDGSLRNWEFGVAGLDGWSVTGHNNTVSGLAVQGDKIVSVAKDDSLIVSPLAGGELGNKVALGGPATAGVAASKDGNRSFTATPSNLLVVNNGNVTGNLDVGFRPLSIALSIDETTLAVGGDDNGLYLFNVDGDNLSPKGSLVGHRGHVLACSFSPDGQYLAATDGNREVIVWDVAKSARVNSGWVFHSSRVNAVSWSPDSSALVTGSLDTNIYVWFMDESKKRVSFLNAHQGGVSDVVFIDNTNFVSTGLDGLIRSWTLE